MSKTFEQYVEEYGSPEDHSGAQEEFRRVMESLFNRYPDLIAVQYTGWTPGWNDGEPCTHSEDMFAFFRDFVISDGYGEFEEYDGEIHFRGGKIDATLVSPEALKTEHTARTIIEGGGRRWNRDEGRWNNYTVDMPEYVPAAKLLTYQPLSHYGWDTNYTLFVTRTPDGVSIVADDYECGY